MMTYANTSTSSGTSVTIGPGPLLVNGRDGCISLFSPTAMDLTDSGGGLGAISEQATRTSTTCFMRGFSERIRIQTSSGIPWFWRRIVFSSKRPQVFNSLSQSPSAVQTNGNNPAFIDTSNGMERLYFNQAINIADQTIAQWYTILFRGVRDKDWTDPLTAAVDPTRVDLMSDTHHTIRSGNQAGTVKDYKKYVSMNKNLVYDDDESGDGESSSYTSVQDKRGLGDVYILDLFYPGTGATVTDLLQLTSSSNLYWHEK